VVHSETLILTEDILNAAYGSGTHPEFFKTTPDLSAYPTAFEDSLQNEDEHLGYVYNVDDCSIPLIFIGFS